MTKGIFIVLVVSTLLVLSIVVLFMLAIIPENRNCLEYETICVKENIIYSPIFIGKTFFYQPIFIEDRVDCNLSLIDKDVTTREACTLYEED